jgi:hypothetical protein
MAFNQTKNTTTVNLSQEVNVGVEVTPQFNFGSEFLSPIAQSLTAINEGLVSTYQPLTQSIQGSIDNVNRLAGDVRRTGNFSLSPSAGPQDSGPSPLLMLAGGLVLAVVLYKLL